MSDFEDAWLDVKNGVGNKKVCCPAHDDRNPSCTLWLDVDNKVGIHCKSRDCDKKEMYDAVGWVTLYDYKDQSGKLVYQSWRVNFPDGTKELKQRRPDGKGGWIWDLDGVTYCLYNLPGVSDAETVYIVEGEKCAEALISRGLTATTNPLGAGSKWRDNYSEALRRKSLILIPDNDEVGQKHIQKVAKSVAKVAESVTVVELPGLSEKSDIYDWLEAGHTIDELHDLADAAEEYELPAKEEAVSMEGQPKSRPGKRPTTELGNAERFADEYSNRLRFVSELKAWIECDGSRFRFVSEERAYQLMKLIVRCIDCEVLREKDSDKRLALKKWAIQSEKKSVMANSLSLAEKEECLTVSANQLDRNPWLITVQNGTIDLRTGELRESDTEDLITKQVPVLFDLSATCPRWITFLERVIPDSGLRLYLQKAVGYSLTGQTTEQIMFFLYGLGQNGKSVFINIVEALLGGKDSEENYAAKMASDSVMASKWGNQGGNTPELVKLRSARLVTVSEVSQGHKLNEALIKDLTGGDSITACAKYKAPITFRPTFKLWMYGNYKPNINGTDEGIWRRIKLVPFSVTIPSEERDNHLEDKLLAELPGILNWALEGCLKWQKEGLGEPEVVADAVKEYREDQDIFGGFLSENCEVGPAFQVSASDLFAAYVAWCKRAEMYVHTQTSFGRNLTQRGFGSEKRGGNAYRVGLRLTTEARKLNHLNETPQS